MLDILIVRQHIILHGSVFTQLLFYTLSTVRTVRRRKHSIHLQWKRLFLLSIAFETNKRYEYLLSLPQFLYVLSQ